MKAAAHWGLLRAGVLTTLLVVPDLRPDVLPRLRVASKLNQLGETAALGASAPVVSADGTSVAFVSRSPNLVTNATTGEINVFLRMVAQSNTVLVSRSLAGAGGNDHSVLPSLSSNGQFVAFQSDASNLVTNDGNNASDIFVYDTASDAVRLVSANTQNTCASGASTFPIMSEDGRYVAFQSTAPDLVANDFNGASDVFRRDLVSGDTTLISIADSASAEGESHLLGTTPDGRFVIFRSTATNIVSGTTNGPPNLYVRDAAAGITYCPTKGLQISPFRKLKNAITPDGRYVLFEYSNVREVIYRVDLITGSRTFVGYGYPDSDLAISSDGSKAIFHAYDGLSFRDISVSTNRIVVPYTSDPLPPPIRIFTVDRAFTRLVYIYDNLPVIYPYYGFSNDLVYVYNLTLDRVDQVLRGVIPPVSLSSSGNIMAYEVSAETASDNDLNGAPDVYLAYLNGTTNILISQAHSALPEVTGSGFSTLLPNALTARGDRILFLSTDTSLARNDTNSWDELFLHDYWSNAVSWSAYPVRSNRTWSVHGPLVPAAPPSTNFLILSNSAHSASITPDGNFAVFARSIGDRLATQTNIYRAILSNDFVEPIALRSSASALGFSVAVASNPSISQDGRRIAFQTPGISGFLNIPVTADFGPDILVREYADPFARTSTSNPPVYLWANVSRSGYRSGNGPSWSPQISLDGSWVFFISLGTDLLPDDLSPGLPRLFARDLSAGKTRLVSEPSISAVSSYVVSPNGRYVVYQTINDASLYLHDLLATGVVRNIHICAKCGNASISGDGRLITYQTISFAPTLFLFDAQQKTTELIAPNASEASISQDGRFIAFTSRASDLVPNDNNGTSDVFLRDRWRGTTHLLSATPSGTSGNGPSSKPQISPDGRRIAFQSFANDLVEGDFNNRRDVFFTILDPPDTDRDMLDDDWEEHYFGDLSRNGYGDFDSDGFADRDEYKMGTDPTNPLSNLRLTEISSSRVYTADRYTQSTVLSWQAAPGRLYRLQVKTNILNGPWLNMPGDIVPGGPIAQKTDITTEPLPPPFYSPHQFYRVSFLE